MVTVRQATASDIEALARIGEASFTAAYMASSHATDFLQHVDEHFSIAAITHAMSLPKQSYIVALVDGEVAGFARIRERPGPNGVPKQDVIELQQLYVGPEFQRVGVGARLIDAVVQAVHDRSAAGVWLSAWEQADWATGFYRKVGFEAVGTAEFRIGKTTYNDLVMYRPAHP